MVGVDDPPPSTHQILEKKNSGPAGLTRLSGAPVRESPTHANALETPTACRPGVLTDLVTFALGGGYITHTNIPPYGEERDTHEATVGSGGPM